jgi:hypothetical protein
VLVQADHAPHAVGFAGLQAFQTGRGQIGPQAAAPPGLLPRQMAAVMLPGRTALGLNGRPTADGEACMPRDGGGASRPGTRSAQRTVTGVAASLDHSCTPHRGPDSSTGCARASAKARSARAPMHRSRGASHQREQADRATGGTSHARDDRNTSAGEAPPGVPAEMTIARTHIPRCSVRGRSMTLNGSQRRSISSWGRIASQTCRTSSPVMA